MSIKVDILLPAFERWARQQLGVVPQEFLKDAAEIDRCA